QRPLRPSDLLHPPVGPPAPAARRGRADGLPVRAEVTGYRSPFLRVLRVGAVCAGYRSHCSGLLGAAPGRLHVAAHSHPPWPDVTFEAQQEAWLDAARLADDKWDGVFCLMLAQADA